MSKPGYVRGKHFTEYVDRVKCLKKTGDDNAAEALLLELVEATEAESRNEGFGVAPWYYEQLAVIYAKRKDLAAEIAILERYDSQPHAPGAMPAKLKERLTKKRALIELSS